MAIGPSGWTRTTTARVKSPACCVDTTEGLELIPGVQPGRRPYQGRRLPLHQISVERMVGLEPTPQGLEGPQATATPHSLWFGLRVSNPSLRAGNAECSSTPRPNAGRWAHRPDRHSRQLSKNPLLRAVGGKGFEPNRPPEGRTGLRPVSGPSARTARLGDSARNRTRTPELWRLGCFSCTTLPFRFTSRSVFCDKTSP